MKNAKRSSSGHVSSSVVGYSITTNTASIYST